MRQANNVAVTTREHVHSDLSNPFAFVEKVGISGLFDDVKSNDHPEQASASASGYPQTKQERMDLINSLREAELPSRLKRAVEENNLKMKIHIFFRNQNENGNIEHSLQNYLYERDPKSF